MLVLEGSEHLRLARESATQLDVVRDPGVQQLDRDIALQVPVVGAPDGSHAALADAGTKLVAAGEKVGHPCEIARFRGKQARNDCEL